MLQKAPFTFFIANNLEVGVNLHFGFQLVISLDKPFIFITNGNVTENSMGYILNRRIEQSFITEGTILVVKFNLDSVYNKCLKKLLRNKPFIGINEMLKQEEITSILPQHYNTMPDSEIIFCIESFINRFLGRDGDEVQKDKRIVDAINYIESNIDRNIKLEQISKVMCLSETRSRHFFSEATGSPFKQYVLWLRVRKCMEEASYKKTNLASLVIQYGFADQAHFTKMFKKMYGVTPTSLMQYSSLVKF